MNVENTKTLNFKNEREFKEFFNDLQKLGMPGHRRLKAILTNRGWSLQTEAKPQGLGRFFEWIWGEPEANKVNTVAYVLSNLLQENHFFFKNQQTANLLQTQSTLSHLKHYLAHPTLAQTIDQLVQKIEKQLIKNLAIERASENGKKEDLAIQIESQILENPILKSPLLESQIQAKFARHREQRLKQETEESIANIQSQEAAAEQNYQEKLKNILIHAKDFYPPFREKTSAESLDIVLHCQDGDLLSHSLFLSPLHYFNSSARHLFPKKKERGVDGIWRQSFSLKDYPLKIVHALNVYYCGLKEVFTLDGQEACQLLELANLTGAIKLEEEMQNQLLPFIDRDNAHLWAEEHRYPQLQKQAKSLLSQANRQFAAKKSSIQTIECRSYPSFKN